jgi:hypothetical protein
MANTGFKWVMRSGRLRLFSVPLDSGIDHQTEQHPAKTTKDGGFSVNVFASSVPSRRRRMRLPATRDVWVYWEGGGRADVSHVRDLSTGGIFIETLWPRTKGDVIRVHFLVQEGQISLDSVVAQTQPSEGLGLKFQTVSAKDVSKLSLLLDRVRAAFLQTPRHLPG